MFDQEAFSKEALESYNSLPEEADSLYTRRYVAPRIGGEHGKASEEEARRLYERVRSVTGISFDAVVWDGGMICDRGAGKPISYAGFRGDAYSGLVAGSAFAPHSDKYAALIEATAKGAVTISTKKGEMADMRLLFVGSAAPLPVRVSVDLAEGSRLHMFEWYSSEPGGGRFSGVLREIRCGRGAQCSIDVLHNEDHGTSILEHTTADARQDSNVMVNFIYSGGRDARSRGSFSATGHNSRVRVSEMAISSKRQKYDLNTRVVNSGGNSEAALYTSAVAMDESLCYLKGFAGIANGARNARSFVEERGMLIGERARINSIPSMAIGESMVKATHSSATGPIDPDSIFYLMTKGISERSARQLLVSGFFSVPVGNIGDPIAREVTSSVLTAKIRSSGEFGGVPWISPSSTIWSSSAGAGLDGHYKYRSERTGAEDET